MIGKIKNWIFGNVIMKKVAAKFAKHATGIIIGLISSGKVAAILTSLGITIDPGQLETGTLVFITAAFGAIWNFVEHRFVKK